MGKDPMHLHLFDTYTRTIRDFAPLQPPQVGLYTCGPTVYNYAHLGNLRTYLFEDILRRVLAFNGYQVKHVMNITDVGHMTDDANADGGGEDKMQAAARRVKEDKKSGKVPDGAVQNPDDPYQIAKYLSLIHI